MTAISSRPQCVNGLDWNKCSSVWVIHNGCRLCNSPTSHNIAQNITQNRNMHISFLSGVLLDMWRMHLGICDMKSSYHIKATGLYTTTRYLHGPFIFMQSILNRIMRLKSCKISFVNRFFLVDLYFGNAGIILGMGSANERGYCN